MDSKTWQQLENRFFAIVVIVLLVLLFSAIGENKIQRQSPDYQPIGRGY